MSASQFEKITDYGQFEHLGGGVADNDLLPWRHCHSTPTPQGYGVGGEDQEECVIANICPLSPLSNGGAPTTSSDDQPDTPGMTRAQSFDLVVFDVRKVPPELIAAQISLLDLDIFKAIRMEEFHNHNWTRKDKKKLAPNIVAFTQRFNQTSFLVVREILNEENEKARAEVITHFIKIAKKLYELNNIHGMKAVVSSLQSGPIFRLTQTWRHVPKKDKAHFERFSDFLSEDENRRLLREHMDEAKLPCIPHLGLYLTDLSYLHGIPNKGYQVECILNLIAYCQNSSYDSYVIEPHVKKYLTRLLYIDELQTFFEDENYKRSLKYEPREPFVTPILWKCDTTEDDTTPQSERTILRTSKSHEDLLTASKTEEEDPESPFHLQSRHSQARRSFNSDTKRSKSHRYLDDLRPVSSFKHKLSLSNIGKRREDHFTASLSADMGSKVKPVPSNSAGVLVLPAITKPSIYKAGSFEGKRSDVSQLPRASISMPTSATQKGFPPSPLSFSKNKRHVRGHAKSHSMGSNVFATLGVSKPTIAELKASPSPDPSPLSLLDDSLLDDSFPLTPTGSLGNASTTSGGSSHASMEDFSEGDHLYRHVGDYDDMSYHSSHHGGDIVKDGTLKRKTLKRKGNTVSQLRGRSKCWVILTSNAILFMDTKPSHDRKKSKVKSVLLQSCQLKHRDVTEKLSDEQFIINDDDGNSTRLTAKSSAAAMEWVVAIKEAIREEEERARKEAECSLIKL